MGDHTLETKKKARLRVTETDKQRKESLVTDQVRLATIYKYKDKYRSGIFLHFSNREPNFEIERGSHLEIDLI